MNQFYRGTRPHAEEASEGTLANVDAVVRNKSLNKLDSLLANADSHAYEGRITEAKITLQAAIPLLDELLVLARTGASAFEETCRRCGEPSPPNEFRVSRELLARLETLRSGPDETATATLDRLIANQVTGNDSSESDEDSGKRKGKSK